jgi:hypothetical protein
MYDIKWNQVVKEISKEDKQLGLFFIKRIDFIQFIKEENTIHIKSKITEDEKQFIKPKWKFCMEVIQKYFNKDVFVYGKSEDIFRHPFVMELIKMFPTTKIEIIPKK